MLIAQPRLINKALRKAFFGMLAAFVCAFIGFVIAGTGDMTNPFTFLAAYGLNAVGFIAGACIAFKLGRMHEQFHH